MSLDLKRKHDINLDEVRSYPGFSHFTDEQAAEVVRTFKEFTEIVYYTYMRERLRNNDSAS